MSPCTLGHGERAKDIFISYGRGSVSGMQMHELKQELENVGYSVWVDTNDISTGEDWHSIIGAAITDSQALVPLITAKYCKSQHCKKELFMASSLGKPILPVLLESSVDDPGVRYAISSVNWIQSTEGFKPKTVAKQLIKGLRSLNI